MNKDKFTIKCSICGKEKRYNPYRFLKLKSKPKFCSNECKYENFRRTNKPKYGFIDCLNCGKKVYNPPFQQKKGRKFCSKSCAGKFNIKNLGTRMSGKKHSKETKVLMSKSAMGKNLKPFSERKMNVAKAIRQSPEYTNWWRLGIYKDDNFTCVKCGQVGGELNVHHIIPLSMIVKYVRKVFGEQNLLENLFNFPITFDFANGITLCEKCHKETDSYLNKGLKRKSDDYYFKEIEIALLNFLDKNKYG